MRKPDFAPSRENEFVMVVHAAVSYFFRPFSNAPFMEGLVLFIPQYYVLWGHLFSTKIV